VPGTVRLHALTRHLPGTPALDPPCVAEHEAAINSAPVRELALVVPLAMERGGGLLADLERDLPLLLAAAHGLTADHGSVDDFTESALGWYKNHSGEVGAWAEVPLIVLSFTPSSAAAERVFSSSPLPSLSGVSLLKALFGSNQDMALANNI